MAGSRIHKYGTIYSRTIGLIEGGALKEKPHWVQIYEKFPPRVEPNLFRPPSAKPIRDILYPEDSVRARFYEKYSLLYPIDLLTTDKRYRPTVQLFTDRFLKNKETMKNLTEDELFEFTDNELTSEGRLNMQEPKKEEDEQPESSRLKVNVNKLFKS